jgi:hypothetical protein
VGVAEHETASVVILCRKTRFLFGVNENSIVVVSSAFAVCILPFLPIGTLLLATRQPAEQRRIAQAWGQVQEDKPHVNAQSACVNKTQEAIQETIHCEAIQAYSQ